MADGTSSLTDVARQIEAALAQLRILTTEPDTAGTQQNQDIIAQLQQQLDRIQQQMTELKDELQSFRDITDNRLEALEIARAAPPLSRAPTNIVSTTNDVMYIANHRRQNLNGDLRDLLNVRTREPITGLPTSIEGVLALDGKCPSQS